MTQRSVVENVFLGNAASRFGVVVGQPMRERYDELRGDESQLEQILQGGAAQASAIAAETLADVRERMGVGPPR